MAIQTANLGTPPSGAGGDTFRSAAAKYNENFANNAHAASRLVGAQAGNLMEVGAFGIGVHEVVYLPLASNSNEGRNASAYLNGVIYRYGDDINALTMANSSIWKSQIGMHPSIGNLLFRQISSAGVFGDWTPVYSTKNTTVDSNGFIKAASPIVKLFAEKIELNEEAKQQDPLFEKLDIGHYLIKNTLGFSELGWYIEMPKDANGNVLVAVQYEQLEDQTIEVKTFAKKFDEETGDLVPNLEKPRDIPSGRWIDIRLQEMSEPELVLPESNTPASFQPTGIAQAVSEMMNGTEQ